MIHCCPECTRFYNCLAEARGYVCGTPSMWRCPACASAHARGQGFRNYPEIPVAYLSKEEARIPSVNHDITMPIVLQPQLQISEIRAHGFVSAVATAPNE
jgi:hypothetical protein